jgi:glucose-6-phosphate-specific signal transduction histidine kinase
MEALRLHHPRSRNSRQKFQPAANRRDRLGKSAKRLSNQDGVLLLEVRDNGKGVKHEQLSAASLGILGMRERALLLGGDLTITGAPGQGTMVSARIPVGENRE